MNIQVDPASAMLNSKIRPRAVVGYGVKIFHPSPPNYVTSPGYGLCNYLIVVMILPFIEMNGILPGNGKNQYLIITFNKIF